MIRLWSGSGIILECVDRKNQKGRLTICWYALVGQALNNLLSVSSRFSPTSSHSTSININPLIYCNHLYKPLIYIYIYLLYIYAINYYSHYSPILILYFCGFYDQHASMSWPMPHHWPRRPWAMPFPQWPWFRGQTGAILFMGEIYGRPTRFWDIFGYIHTNW